MKGIECQMIYLNLNAWCADFQVGTKEVLVSKLMEAKTVKQVESVFSSKAIKTVGYFVYLHLDQTRGCWILPRSLN